MSSPRARRTVVVLSALALLATPAPTHAGAATPPARVPPGLHEAAARLTATAGERAAKAPTSRLADSDAGLLARGDAERVPVVIKLDYDPAATYVGGVPGLEATSPAVTGRNLSTRAPAVRAHDTYAARREAVVVAAIRSVAPEATFGRSLRLVYGGVAAVVPAHRVRQIAGVDGVVAVQADALAQPLTDSSREFIGAPTVYGELGSDSTAGAGLIFANLDTGLWPEHPSFADLGNLAPPPPRADGTPRTCRFGDNPLTPATDPFVCQRKLIGGEDFLDTYDALFGDEGYPGTARDAGGHGTHTASTSAGNVVPRAEVLGVDRGAIGGVAPGAAVIGYRVCGPRGCYGSDSAAAVAEAILDGVDVINFSISGGTNPFSDPVELAFLDAYAAGVFVAASAGNDGPGAGTVNHLSPWVTSVAASTQTREFRSRLTLTGPGGAAASYTGATITAGAGPAPVVLAATAPYGDALCASPAPAGSFAGKVVACRRGVNARVEKGFNVLQGGAVGMILYNPALADVETDNHWLPTVHLADGSAFVAFLSANPGAVATWTAGQAASGQSDVMAAFSSRGPGGSFVKPDVTAPGVQILAGHTPTPEAIVNGPPGEYFQAIAGTSMSAPHVAGSALLLRALHPAWTPGQIRSALMTTATTDVVKEDLVTPADPFDMGAGRIDLHVAGDVSLTFDESAERYAALGNDPANAVHLNVPSINAPVMPGRLTTTRVATNNSSRRQSFTTAASSDAGSISVQPRRFSLDPGRSATVTVTIEAEPDGQQHFGAVRITAGRGATVHLPVAFVAQQSAVTLTQSCAPLTIERLGLSTCTVTARNGGANDTSVDLRTTTTGPLRVRGTTGATMTNDRTAVLDDAPLGGSLSGVPAVAPGASPYGYVPLDAFPDPLIVPVGDEEILNLELGGSTFTFAGNQFGTIGITSNGYAVAGGGSAEDVAFEGPGVPDPARPNNVLAPFWTDLDGTGETGILANVLSDGTNAWLVVEWRLHVFGNPTADRVFQLWAGLDGPEDLSFAYDPANLPGAPGIPLAVGAENVDGSGGSYRTTPPTGDQRVTSTDPTPGDSVTYVVTVQGWEPGTGTVTTTMEATGVAGTTEVSADIRVLRPRRGGSGPG